MKYRLLYALVIASLFSPGFAEETTPSKKESIFMAGVGTLMIDQPQKGVDTDLYVLPLLIDTEHHLLIFGTNIRYVLLCEDGWMFSAAGASRLEGYDNSESRHLSGMHNRHNTYELGAALSKEFSWGKLEGLFLADVLDEHRGQEFRFNYSKSFSDILNITSLELTPSVGFNWRSHQLNDYYYGVKSYETTAARQLYQTGSATNILTGLRADYSLNDRWNLFGSLNVEWLNNEITDSPVVDKHYLLSFFLGAMYQF